MHSREARTFEMQPLSLWHATASAQPFVYVQEMQAPVTSGTEGGTTAAAVGQSVAANGTAVVPPTPVAPPGVLVPPDPLPPDAVPPVDSAPPSPQKSPPWPPPSEVV